MRASEQRFREQSLQDNLTGLYNQRYLYQALPVQINESLAVGGRLSLLFLDIDNFKQVVDAHGHLNGSRAIQEVAETIRRAVEPPAWAVAYAGDEFVVVLPRHDPSRAEQAARQLQSRIHQTTFLAAQGIGLQLRISCGIATCPDHADGIEGLLYAADTALFGVKGRTKGTIRHYR